MNIAIAVSKLTLTGGMERYSIDLIKGLNEQGIEPYVLTAKFDPALLATISFKPIIIYRPKFFGKLGIYLFNLQLNFIKRKYNIDFLIACNRNSHSEIAICGGTHIGYLNAINKTPNLWDKLEIFLEKKLYKNAKFIIAHSKLMAKELQEFYSVDSTKLKVIYPPINSSVFTSASKERRALIRESNDWADDETILLFPSSGHERKGLPYIISSIKDSKNSSRFKLIVLGKENARYAEDFVHYQGFRNDIETLYQAVDFTVLASTYEPFGLVGPESVLCGTPCLFANTIGAKEVLSQESCHVFSIDSKEEPQLKDLFTNINELTKRIDNQKCHINYDISLANHTHQILALLSGIRVQPKTN